MRLSSCGVDQLVFLLFGGFCAEISFRQVVNLLSKRSFHIEAFQTSQRKNDGLKDNVANAATFADARTSSQSRPDLSSSMLLTLGTRLSMQRNSWQLAKVKSIISIYFKTLIAFTSSIFGDRHRNA